MNESKMKSNIAAIANYLRDNYGSDCCGIRRDINTGTIRDLWYKLHFAYRDDFDPCNIWKFDSDSGDCATDFNLSLISRRYFSTGKRLYAIRQLTYQETQNIPKVLISKNNDPFICNLELVYSFTLSGDDSRSIMGSMAPEADFTFMIDNVTYTARDRTYDLAVARCAVNIVRKFYK